MDTPIATGTYCVGVDDADTCAFFNGETQATLVNPASGETLVLPGHESSPVLRGVVSRLKLTAYKVVAVGEAAAPRLTYREPTRRSKHKVLERNFRHG